MEQEIKSVEKGVGETSIFFTTYKNAHENNRVDEIKEEKKQVETDRVIGVYRGYKNKKLVFEMGISLDVTVAYE